MSEKDSFSIQALAVPILTVMVMTAFFYYAEPILLPVVLGITMAFVLMPIVNLFKRLKLPHTAAVLITVTLTVLILLAIGTVIAAQASDLVERLPEYWKQFQVLFASWLEKSPWLARFFPAEFGKDGSSIIDLIKWKEIASVGGYLLAGLGSALNLLWQSVVVLLITTFILLEQVGFRHKLANLFGLELSSASRKMVDQISDKVSGFLIVKVLTSAALGLVVTIALIIMGVPYAYVWGPLAGLLNLIPYIGAYLGAIPPMIVASIEYSSMWWMLYLGAFFLVIQFLEGNIITPKLVGDRINMNLTSVMIATIYWGWLWGGVGMLLALPITATFKVICDHVEALKPIGTLLDGSFKG